MSTRPFEIGLFTFGEITADPTTGQLIDPAARLREFIELAKIGDQAGLDVFGVGEHATVPVHTGEAHVRNANLR